MLSLGPLAFTAPWLLVALVAVPLLWWLLRVTPPAPLRVRFPAVRLLFGLVAPNETTAKTPPWLIALRLLLATLAIVALAHPLWRPQAPVIGTGALVLVIDDGWAAAPDWPLRQAALDGVLAHAERGDRPVLLLTTAPDDRDGKVAAKGMMGAAEARAVVRALAPKPWSVDRARAREALRDVTIAGAASVLWLSDGLEDGGSASLVSRLMELGPLTVQIAPPGPGPFVLLPPASRTRDLELVVRRLGDAGTSLSAWVRASGEDGRLLGRGEVVFAEGEDAASATLALPAELRNRIARLDIEDERSAAAAVLLDERWRRRPVGLVSGAPIERDQPLLSDVYFAHRALEPITTLRQAELAELLEDPPAVIVFGDVAKVPGPDRPALDVWLEAGGVLVRFAGPRFAEAADDLVPVTLRGGGRTIGGAMSWEKPARLLPFGDTSPFFGLAIPKDVLVARQVLAEPNLDLPDKTWAQLEDGTSLVTAERRGQGWLILVHTTANTAWSNLALSGLFVEMLQRLIELSAGVPADGSGAPLPPLTVLDGFGVLGTPPSSAQPIAADAFAEATSSPASPPGYWGSKAGPRTLNLGPRVAETPALDALPDAAAVTTYGVVEERDLLPWLAAAAILLGLVELLASLLARGQLLRRASAVAAATLALLVLAAASAEAVDDAEILAAIDDLHLAYVMTGNPEVDRISAAGLFGLGTILRSRTSVEPADPIGIDLESDELVFFPMVYWPITLDQSELSDYARAKVDHYLRTGGILVLDTRDPEASLAGGARSGNLALRRLLAGLSIPPLIPVPPDHVLTRAFYLIDELPGRWIGDQVWIEQGDGGINDGVSSIVIGSHDWAAAWAMDARLQPLLPVVPGGERQREMAYRFGVNLVMYAATGNYKTDAVHVPAILERLGE